MKRETFDLSAVARSVAEELRQAEPSRKVTFDIAGDLVAEGDKRLLRIALFNLLGNAWKYTSKHPKATISVGIGAGNGIKAFFVRDDGAGFDMTYAGKLFEPFQRLHTIHEFEGTGIGLATVQRIVSRHGGRVWADGVPEAGATFYFTLSPDGKAEETSWSDQS
jgi:light-regulated signal transduction histidine kinase (bacteriophytochrome)